MYKELIDDARKKFEDSLTHLVSEYQTLRTGRAHPGLVEHVMVEYYGSHVPLKQTANVTVPEPRQILISPWSPDSIKDILKAIRESDLGLTPADDGKVIRITLPQLTEERRKDLVKVVGKKAEDAKISVRTVREELWQEIQEMQKSGDLTEDEKFQAKEYLQKIVDEFNRKIEELEEKKKNEVLTV